MEDHLIQLCVEDLWEDDDIQKCLQRFIGANRIPTQYSQDEAFKPYLPAPEKDPNFRLLHYYETKSLLEFRNEILNHYPDYAAAEKERQSLALKQKRHNLRRDGPFPYSYGCIRRLINKLGNVISKNALARFYGLETE